MKQPPNIVVQLVHIEGPLKGEIHECPLPEITIGRLPSCDVRFPKDVLVLSRQHARIVREGNRFKIIDQSANGTFLNGKEIKEAYLREGDVLMFAEGGPKASFLTKTVAHASEDPAPQPKPQPSPEPPRWEQPPARSEPVSRSFRKPVLDEPYARPQYEAPSPVRPATSFPSNDTPRQIPVQQIKKPLIIQYGPTLRSFNELPVTIGQGARCDFTLNHPAIFERHAQVFFYQDQYWIKDLSGRNLILIDGRSVGQEAALRSDCRLSLSPGGPEFIFLGEGRLAEVESAAMETPDSIHSENIPGQPKDLSPASDRKDIGGMMKRFFKK